MCGCSGVILLRFGYLSWAVWGFFCSLSWHTPVISNSSPLVPQLAFLHVLLPIPSWVPMDIIELLFPLVVAECIICSSPYITWLPVMLNCCYDLCVVTYEVVCIPSPHLTYPNIHPSILYYSFLLCTVIPFSLLRYTLLFYITGYMLVWYCVTLYYNSMPYTMHVCAILFYVTLHYTVFTVLCCQYLTLVSTLCFATLQWNLTKFHLVKLWNLVSSLTWRNLV